MPDGYADRLVKGTARAFANGLTFNNADEIEAGLRSHLPLNADDAGKDYRTIRDDVRGRNAEYASENPLMNFGANAAGMAVTGTGLMKAAEGAPWVMKLLRGGAKTPEAATWVNKALGAGAGGGMLGALNGPGSAAEIGDIPKSTVVNIGAGAALGAGASAVGSAIGGARNVAAGIGQHPDGAAGWVRKLIQTSTPQAQAARNVLVRAARGGMDVDALEAASKTAPANAALGELIPDQHGVAGLRIGRNAGRERGLIDASLGERAAEAPDAWARTMSQHSGVSGPRNAAAYGEQALAEVRPEVDRLSTLARQQPDVVAPEIAGVMEDLHGLGERGILTRAGHMSFGRGNLATTADPTEQISVANLQHLREAFDRRMAVLNGENVPDAKLLDILGQRRAIVDRALKAAGGESQRASDLLWSNAKTKGESFNLGQRVENETTPEGITNLGLSANNPKAFQEGSMSRQLERVGNISDGEAGQTRNPTQATMGSPTRRARAATGYPSQDAFEQARAAGRVFTDQAITRHAVSGNSTTAANLHEMADEFASDPSKLLDIAVHPSRGLAHVGKSLIDGSARGINAQTATQMGRLFGAGLPGQMPTAEAIAVLRQLSPNARQQFMSQLIRSGASGASLASMFQPDGQ